MRSLTGLYLVDSQGRVLSRLWSVRGERNNHRSSGSGMGRRSTLSASCTSIRLMSVCKAKGKGQRAEGRGQRAEGRGQRAKVNRVNRDLRTADKQIGSGQAHGKKGWEAKKVWGSKSCKKKCDLVGVGVGMGVGMGVRGTGTGTVTRTLEREWQQKMDGLFDASKDRRHLRHWRSETGKRSCKAKETKLQPPKFLGQPNSIYINELQYTVSLCVCVCVHNAHAGGRTDDMVPLLPSSPYTSSLNHGGQAPQTPQASLRSKKSHFLTPPHQKGPPPRQWPPEGQRSVTHALFNTIHIVSTVLRWMACELWPPMAKGDERAVGSAGQASGHHRTERKRAQQYSPVLAPRNPSFLMRRFFGADPFLPAPGGTAVLSVLPSTPRWVGAACCLCSLRTTGGGLG